jgi:hypothetical protein
MKDNFLVTWHEDKDKLGDHWEPEDPDCDESFPELIFECCRIFEPEDEDVPA